MNKLIHALIIATFTLASYSVLAADQTITEDAKEGLIQDKSADQTMEQSMGSSTKMVVKTWRTKIVKAAIILITK